MMFEREPIRFSESRRSILTGRLACRIILSGMLVAILLVFFAPVAVQAGFSKNIPYSATFVNNTGFTIPKGVKITVNISASVSGTMTITSPSGKVTNITMSSLPYSASITLAEAGVYSISENYEMLIRGTISFPGIPPIIVPYSGSSSWQINNPAPGTGKVEASSRVSNLSIGQIVGPITVSLDDTSLPTTANIRTTAPIPNGASVSVTVNGTWTIDSSVSGTGPKVGTIKVNTNLDSATFNLSGPANYSGSGKSWTQTEAPAGGYTITYGAVVGYETPPSEMKTLTAGGTITFTGTYEPVGPSVGTIKVNTNLDSATFSLSGPGVTYSGSGRSWTQTEAPTGDYTITYGSVEGYVTPPSETKILNKGGTITFTGTYKPPAGTIKVFTNLDEATFSLSGPASYTGSGRSWTQTEAPVGNYIITYNAIEGYEKPPSETKTLIVNGTITFTGIYRSMAPSTGTIAVYTNLDSAVFRLSGPASYSGSGRSWAQTGVPVGDYTISYDDVEGYETPPSETKTLTAGGTITFTGTYRSITLLTGTIKVNTNIDIATFSLSGPVNYTGTGRSWTQTEAPVGDYTITYDDVEGYETPPQEMKTLTAGGTITFTGTYKSTVPSTGTIEVHTNLDSATFNLSGPVNYTGGGKSWTQTEAPSGEYTITFGDVPLYTAPSPEKKSLSPGDKITFAGAYIPVAPKIKTVHITGSPAKSGGAIGISVTSDPNCSTTFSIDGVASGNLTESPAGSGVYTGGFKAPKDVNAIDVPVQITVTNALGVEASDSSQKVTVDTLAVISSVHLSNERPAIGETVTITVKGDAYGFASFSIKGVVSGQMEEDPASRGTYKAGFKVLQSMPKGTKPVEIKLFDPAGNVSINSDQMITIGFVPKITSVSVSGSPAKFGGIIAVSMSGEPRGGPTFSIAGVVDDVPMAEITSGSYKGEYIVPQGKNVKDAALTVKMAGGGLEVTNTDNKVTIDSVPPVIDSVEVSGSPARRLGDVIAVKLSGESACTATFSIGDIAKDIPMPEIAGSPGKYEGSYNVSSEINLYNIQVVVTLRDAIGNVNVNISNTVTISTFPWDVNNDGVVDRLDLEITGSRLGSTSDAKLDINRDGIVNILDLTLIGKHFGQSPGERQGAPGEETPRSYLFQNYPNPINPGTWIPFTLSRGGKVTITIYSSSGRLIRRLDLGYKEPGVYVHNYKAVYWDGNNDSGEKVASGVYFYNLRCGDFSATRKMLVSK